MKARVNTSEAGGNDGPAVGRRNIDSDFLGPPGKFRVISRPHRLVLTSFMHPQPRSITAKASRIRATRNSDVENRPKHVDFIGFSTNIVGSAQKHDRRTARTLCTCAVLFSLHGVRGRARCAVFRGSAFADTNRSNLRPGRRNASRSVLWRYYGVSNASSDEKWCSSGPGGLGRR